MRICIIILILLIFLIILVTVYGYLKYRSIINAISKIGDNITTQFYDIAYPGTLPPLGSDDDIAKLSISLVLSAVNSYQGADLYLPQYLEMVQSLPSNYGIVMKPTVESDIDYIVALRGTLSHADFISDIRWVQVPYHGLGNVHSGFAGIAETIYPHLKFQPGSNVIITGHSLGASVAELVATRLAKERNINVYLYISARPRTGDLFWDNNVRKYVNRHILINQSDDVPVFPLPTMVKDKIGYGFIAPQIDETTYFDYQTGSIIDNHNPLVYHYALYKGKPPFPWKWFIG